MGQPEPVPDVEAAAAPALLRPETPPGPPESRLPTSSVSSGLTPAPSAAARRSTRLETAAYGKSHADLRAPDRPNASPGRTDQSTGAKLTVSDAPGPRAAPIAPVRVVLCEDQQIYLAGLRTLLDRDPGVLVVGEVHDPREAGGLAARHTAQVVIVRQGSLSSAGYESLQQLFLGGAAVLVLAESDSELDMVRALRAGARGYRSRRLSEFQLLDSVRALARNELAIDPAVAHHLVSYLVGGRTEAVPPPQPRLARDRLTERQRVVADLVAEGLTNDEIAARLHLSRTTVKSHLAAAMRRLDLGSRTQLAVLVGRELGWASASPAQRRSEA